MQRFLSPDPVVQFPDNSQSYNRYAYVLNNPLKYTDPTGYRTWWDNFKRWTKKEGDQFGDWYRYHHVEDVLVQIASLSNPITGIPTLLSMGSSLLDAANKGDWSRADPTLRGTRINNSSRITEGLFKTDPNRKGWDRVWQFVSRFTWELPQTTLGNFYSHLRNISGNVDRVDFFGGATFLVGENQDSRWGLTLGNYINISITDEIVGNFEGRVISDPLFMHEYGHTFDSQIFGLSYLLVIGLPSLYSAATSEQAIGEPAGVTTHDFRWYEMSANRNAAWYFKKYYGVEWSQYELTYPRKRR